MLYALGMIAGLGAFVCWIMVLIKQFQDSGPLHGIIGIVTCGIWTYIWGWIHSGRLGLRNMMLIWTGLWILGIILQGATIASMFMGGGVQPAM
jgi:hypothetical protein